MAKNKLDETQATEDTEVALPNIESLDDVKDLFNDGVDKIRESSVDEIKEGALKVGNRLFKAWRQLVDGD
jgi:hypothetical protein